MKIYLLTLILLAPTVFAKDEVIWVEEQNQKMLQAFEKARAQVDHFIDIVRNKPEQISELMAYIKVEEDGKVEYLWLADVQPYDDTYLMGYLVSKPGTVKKVKYGATLGILKDEIYDWRYVDTKLQKSVGAFTTCALVDPATQEGAAILKDLNLEC